MCFLFLETVELKVVNTTTIEKGPAEQSIVIHETVRMDCNVLWDPSFDLTVQWKKDNVDVVVDGERVIVDTASVANQALTIKKLRYDDAGKGT